MNYLSAEGLSKSFGDKTLFGDISFGLDKGEKAALIARNGSGKTTLLRILAGSLSPDAGSFTFRKGVRLAFLEQVPVFDPSQSIDELILSANSRINSVIKDYNRALEEHSANATEASSRLLEDAGNMMDRLDAWDYERRMKQLLDLFRIKDTSCPASKLSGGEKKRLALALILLDKPDMLILDEPTNHLDVEMIEWLENYLNQANITLLMVTHDRYFLTRVCNRIIELSSGRIYNYPGNYEYFLEKLAEREELQKTEKAKAGQLMRKELEWLRRSPKARTGKSKARIDAFDEIKKRASVVTEVDDLRLNVSSPRLGDKILELSGLSKAYGKLVILDNFTYKFQKGERLGITGRNGSGKTSFLNLLSGEEAADEGITEVGKTVKMAYYRQLGREWKEDQRVIDAVKEIAEAVRLENGKTISASQYLEHFMFAPEAQYKVIAKLSGGELRRLNLLTVLIENPNFLILDEPTNDLDLFALNRLEEFLLAYRGCLVIVSHDRYFLDKLTDHLFVFEGNGKVKDHYGPYASYTASLGEQRANGKEAESRGSGKKTVSGKATVQVKTRKGLSYKEKKEYDTLEAEIEKLEEEKASLESELNTANLDYSELEIKSKRIADIIALTNEKMDRWMELGSKNN